MGDLSRRKKKSEATMLLGLSSAEETDLGKFCFGRRNRSTRAHKRWHKRPYASIAMKQNVRESTISPLETVRSSEDESIARVSYARVGQILPMLGKSSSIVHVQLLTETRNIDLIVDSYWARNSTCRRRMVKTWHTLPSKLLVSL